MEYYNKQKNVFIFPDVDSSFILVYSPLRGIVFRADQEAKPYIIEHIENKGCSALDASRKLKDNLEKMLATAYQIPTFVGRDRNSVVFIPTQRCNLNCSYCYAQSAHADEDITFDCVKKCLDYLFSLDLGSAKRVSFIGGGEPTISWKLITETVEYINEIKKDTSVGISIATNGTLLTPSMVAYIKRNNIRISLSFDILPFVQDSQRPFKNSKGSFDVVDRNLHLLISHGVIPSIRTTITQLACDKMSEMVRFVHEHYPEIRQVHLEHVSDPSLKSDDLQNYYNVFFEEFWKARSFGVEKGIIVKNSLTTALLHLRYTFCGGEFCVTPDKVVVACHRITSKHDAFYDDMRYGLVTKDALIFDENSNQAIYKRNSELKRKCQSCFARWHCAGGCPYVLLNYNSKQQKALCGFTKKMIACGLSNSIAQASKHTESK